MPFSPDRSATPTKIVCPTGISGPSSTTLNTSISQQSTSFKVGQPSTSLPLGGNTSARMGNGTAIGQQLTIDGEVYDMSKLRSLLPDLKRQVEEKNSRIGKLIQELYDKERQLAERDDEIRRLKAEVDKLKSVLQQKVTVSGLSGQHVERSGVLSTIEENSTLSSNTETKVKRQGVSGESSSRQHGTINLKHVEKDFRRVICSFRKC